MHYLHSSLVITQVKSTVANPQVCMLLSLTNITLKLDDQIIQICVFSCNFWHDDSLFFLEKMVRYGILHRVC